MTPSRALIALALVLTAVLGAWIGVTWLNHPSPETAEKMLRMALDGGWQMHRPDGTLANPGSDDIASIDSISCKRDRVHPSDFPAFACIITLTLKNGERTIGALGATRYQGTDLALVDGYLVRPWAPADQRAIFADRGIGQPK